MSRLGMIGCGGISHAHLRAARNSDRDIRFVACCDVDEARARRWAERYGCEAYHTDMGEMIRQRPLDGVVIATWPADHRRHVEQCLAAGARHILCEKALAVTGAEAMDIRRMVHEAGAKLIEGFMYRHHPAIRKLESLLSAGELGPVDRVRAAFDIADPQTDSPEDPARDWRRRKECAGGVPFDLACYCVNACNHFGRGLPRRVQAVARTSDRYGTVNRLYAMIEHDGGSVGIVASSAAADLMQGLEIVCRQGRLHLPIAWSIYDRITVTEQRSTSWIEYDVREHPIARADPYQLQLENFVDLIADRAVPRVPLDESVANAIVMEAVLTAADEGRAVDVDLPGFAAEALLDGQTRSPEQ